MAKNTTMPAIRFGEFTDAWEQRKLEDVGDIVGGGTPSTSATKYWGGEIDWYAPAEIGEQIFVSGSQKKITELGVQNSSAKILPIGTILFTSRAGIGNTAILAKKGTTNQGFQSIIPHENETDSYFIFSRTHELKHYGEIIGSGSIFVEVSGKQMAQMPILMPVMSEQIKIGTFFATLDRLVTLHRSEYDKTVNIKKALLEKMFPKAGEDKPEFRFAGFTDTWEQKQLSELADFSKGYGYSKSDFQESGAPIILYGRLYTKYETVISDVDTFASAKENSVFSRGHEVIVPASGETAEDIARASVVEYEGVILGGDLNIIYPKSVIESAFLAITISNGWQQKELAKRAQGKSVVHIHNSDLQEVMLVYPKLEEQNAISSFFRSLDRLLTLHQRELVKLQNMKSALLEKMFV